MSENLDHPLYQHCDIKEADGVAWAFINKEKMINILLNSQKLHQMKSE